tara:strand:- start:416 stop:1030 length:615 start_codon:yes stop_codon:yes gene_type:complete
MKILCHRGYWNKPDQQNTIASFKSALTKDYGVEIDVRDFNEEIVISHDIPTKESPKLETLLAEGLHHNLCLAFNIKSDGICLGLKKLIDEFSVSEYFCFDMSIPQQIHYQNMELTWYSRTSDHNEEKVLNSNSHGIWLDCFYSNWWRKENLSQIANKKPIAIVSPELHGREHRIMWQEIKNLGNLHNVFLCTDFPNEAKSFFYD